MSVQPAVIIESAARGRVRDYFELIKPRVTAMVLISTLAGFYLGAGGGGFADLICAVNLLVGTGLASAGTLALNEYVERESDAVMNRTCHRPLPEGRLRPVEAFWFGTILSAAGFTYLFLTVDPLAAAVILATGISYLFAYTPLKRVSFVCNPVGTIPGALPPVAGWAAARHGLGIEPLLLFALMFLWQFPHSLSIGKLYRADYRRAGICLLPAEHAGHKPENVLIVIASILLIAMGVLPTVLGVDGIVYLVVATACGIGMLIAAVALVLGPETETAARRTMFATLIYLPVVLLVMVLDKV